MQVLCCIAVLLVPSSSRRIGSTSMSISVHNVLFLCCVWLKLINHMIKRNVHIYPHYMLTIIVNIILHTHTDVQAG